MPCRKLVFQQLGILTQGARLGKAPQDVGEPEAQWHPSVLLLVLGNYGHRMGFLLLTPLPALSSV